MRGRRGFTLLEFLVAAALAAAVVLVASRQMVSAFRFSNRVQESMELELAKVSIARELETVTRRARGIAGTPFGGTGGAGPNYLVYGQGAMVVQTDLRPCAPPAGWSPNYFHPGLPPPAAAQTTVIYLCCNRGLAMNVNLPLGGTLVANSACTASNGLSIEYRRGGAVTQRKCYGNLGSTGATFTAMRMAAAGSNLAAQVFPAGPAIPIFYVNFVSTDRVITGQAQDERAGRMGLGETINNLEMYVTPGNPAVPNRIKIHPCGRGVQDL